MLRKAGDPIANGSVERLRRERSLSVSNDDIGSARLQSNLPTFLKTSRHPDQRNDRRDADGNSRESQSGAQGATQETADDNSKKGHRLSSETIRPSIMRRILPARPAMVGS